MKKQMVNDTLNFQLDQAFRNNSSVAIWRIDKAKWRIYASVN